MKKLFLLAISVLTLTMVAVSCNKAENSPTAAVEKAMTCLMNGDVAGYQAMLAKKDAPNRLKSSTHLEGIKKAPALKKKQSPRVDMGLASLLKNPNIESFTVSDEQIADNGKNAKVSLTTVLKDGAKKTETISLLLLENDGWKLVR